MTNEQLCALAIAAIDDANARVVLDDALEERDETWETYARRMAWMPGVDLLAIYRNRAKIIASVILFGDWTSTTWSNRIEYPWALAERCRIRHDLRGEFLDAATGSFLDRIAEQAFGILRRASRTLDEETDVELRARCREHLRALTPNTQDR